MNLRQKIELVPATQGWLNDQSREYHYMHKAVNHRAHPFGWAVCFNGEMYQPDGNPSGFIIYSSIHFIKLKNEFGYPGLPTKWQVLMLARLWLHDNLPKFSETCVIGKSLKLVQKRWIEIHPPRFPNEPYHILKVISYANTRLFQGTIYKAANFRWVKKTISRPRTRHNAEGNVQIGDELDCYIYDLKKPNWSYKG